MIVAACTGDAPMTELDFARAVKAKRPFPTTFGCIGPLVTQDFAPGDVAVILDAFLGYPLAEALWCRNHDDAHHEAMRYRICAVHWIDLAGLLRQRALHDDQPEWYRQCCNLLKGMCRCVGWDVRELSNMLISQRVQLT